MSLGSETTILARNSAHTLSIGNGSKYIDFGGGDFMFTYSLAEDSSGNPTFEYYAAGARDVYYYVSMNVPASGVPTFSTPSLFPSAISSLVATTSTNKGCLLYTSDAADE